MVIRDYRGESVLETTVGEVLRLAEATKTPNGIGLQVSEIVLVDDNGADNSDRVIRKLSSSHKTVHPVCLSRNFGRHAATLAGIASSAGEWVVTLDEVGQRDPTDVRNMLDAAVEHGAQVIHGRPLSAQRRRSQSRLTGIQALHRASLRQQSPDGFQQV